MLESKDECSRKVQVKSRQDLFGLSKFFIVLTACWCVLAAQLAVAWQESNSYNYDDNEIERSQDYNSQPRRLLKDYTDDETKLANNQDNYNDVYIQQQGQYYGWQPYAASLEERINHLDNKLTNDDIDLVDIKPEEQQELFDQVGLAENINKKRTEQWNFEGVQDLKSLDDQQQQINLLNDNEDDNDNDNNDGKSFLQISSSNDTNAFIIEDKDFPESPREKYPFVGEVSGLAAMPSGHIAIFHRANREWNETTFLMNHTVSNANKALDESLIRNNTLLIIDQQDGRVAAKPFGSNLFHMPHGIWSDSVGNLWLTDVGLHQVIRLPTAMFNFNATGYANNDKEQLKIATNLSSIRPDIVLGEAFVPGNDEAHFCKPSSVIVSSNLKFVYVADGYCNSRIMVFTNYGKYVKSFGEQFHMNIVHSLALFEDQNLLCASDRERSRVLCFDAGLALQANSNDDNVPSELGAIKLALKYPLGAVYGLAALDSESLLVSSKQFGVTNRFDLSIINPFKGKLSRAWISSDLQLPHALTVTKDSQCAFVGDMSNNVYKKVYKFHIVRKKVLTLAD